MFICFHFYKITCSLKSYVSLQAKTTIFSFFFNVFLHEIELRMKIWCLASNSMSNLIKLCSLSYSFSFSCFQYNTGVSVKKLDLFHIRLLFECFLSRITFLGGFGRERHIKPLEMKSRVSHKIEQRMKIWCLASNSLWNLMKLCSLSYSFSFADFQCNTCVSEKKLLLFHISLLFECFLSRNAFLGGFGRERDFKLV